MLMFGILTPNTLRCVSEGRALVQIKVAPLCRSGSVENTMEALMCWFAIVEDQARCVDHHRSTCKDAVDNVQTVELSFCFLSHSPRCF